MFSSPQGQLAVNQPAATLKNYIAIFSLKKLKMLRWLQIFEAQTCVVCTQAYTQYLCMSGFSIPYLH